MSAQKTLVTAEELLRMSAEGRRCELVDGEVIEMVPTGGIHGRIIVKLAILLGTYVESRALGTVVAGDTGFLLRRDPDTVRAPDVAFLSKERLPAESIGAGFIAAVPDLVVEVISPSDYASQVQAKARAWLDVGARLVWLAYPESKTVVVYRSRRDVTEMSEGDSLDGLPVLPDFSAKVDEIFC